MAFHLRLAIFLMVWTVAGGAQGASSCLKVFQGLGPEAHPRIAVISGTNREGSKTLQVARQVAEILRIQGAEVTLLDIAEVPPRTYSGDQYWKTPKSFQKKFDAPLKGADSVVFVFPEYNGTYPGVLGTFINYLQVSFQGKPIGLIGLSAGILGAQKGADHLSSVLRHMKADVVGEAQVNLPEVEKRLIDGRIENEDLLVRLNRAGQALISRVKGKQKDRRQIYEMLEIVKGTKKSLTFELNSGLQVRGALSEVINDSMGRPLYMKWEGPTELMTRSRGLEGQDSGRHSSGFSIPLGAVLTPAGPQNLSSISSRQQLSAIGLELNEMSQLNYVSGIKLTGILRDVRFSEEGHLQILTFDQAHLSLGKKVLYRPEWGPFDLAIGETIDSLGR